MSDVSNSLIAERLNEYADLLEQQQANRFRIAAYRRAALTVSAVKIDLVDIYRRDGSQGLIELENVGTGIGPRLAAMLARPRAAFHRNVPAGPSVEQLLDVDREYRQKSAREELATITPRRFQ